MEVTFTFLSKNLEYLINDIDKAMSSKYKNLYFLTIIFSFEG